MPQWFLLTFGMAISYNGELAGGRASTDGLDITDAWKVGLCEAVAADGGVVSPPPQSTAGGRLAFTAYSDAAGSVWSQSPSEPNSDGTNLCTAHQRFAEINRIQRKEETPLEVYN